MGGINVRVFHILSGVEETVERIEIESVDDSGSLRIHLTPQLVGSELIFISYFNREPVSFKAQSFLIESPILL